MVGAWLFTKLSVRRGIPEGLANSIVFWSVIGSLVGARVAYVIAHVSDFESPLDWLKIWEGGISLLGGIAGATIANAINIKRQEYRFRFFQVADTIAPCLALGIAIGRIGDLIIGDHLGKPTSWLLAWTYEGGTLAPPFSCADDTCTATLHGGFVETIDRAGATLTDAAGKVIERGVGVHQTALYDMLLAGRAVRVPLVVHPLAPPGRGGHPRRSASRTGASGSWRIRFGSTSASGRSRVRSGRRSPS